MEKWIEITKPGDYKSLSKEYGISPIILRILRNRDYITKEEIDEYLFPSVSSLNDPFLLDGMEQVVSVLKRKIEEKKKIRIIGDYDVDGVASSYILYRGITFFGGVCDYDIPHRIQDGYGINDRLILDAYNAGADTIITCDNGIAAYKQTEYAHSLGLTMIITDHHEVPYEMKDGKKEYILPNADALIDPHTPDSKYPFKGICGAYVAFQTILALAISEGVNESKPFLNLREELLEFTGLATVCDVMELKDENRFLVKEASRLMRFSKNVGLSALIKATEMEGRTLTPYHFGFVIGPCVNAAGRLESAKKAMELFLETNPLRAKEKATELVALNETRKNETAKETERALQELESLDKLPDVIVSFRPDCHESLAGIIAGKIKEHFNHPAFVVTKTEGGLKGSGRSIEAYNMFEGLSNLKVSKYLKKFGGHKLAAGISLDEENLDDFIKALNETASLTEDDFCKVVKIDMALPFNYASLELAKLIQNLEPFGTGNEKPLFAVNSLTFIKGNRIGKNRNVGKYKVLDEHGRGYDLIYFGNLDALEDYIREIYDEKTANEFHSGKAMKVVLGVCYRIEVNVYNGTESVQLQMTNYR